MSQPCPQPRGAIHLCRSTWVQSPCTIVWYEKFSPAAHSRIPCYYTSYWYHDYFPDGYRQHRYQTSMDDWQASIQVSCGVSPWTITAAPTVKCQYAECGIANLVIGGGNWGWKAIPGHTQAVSDWNLSFLLAQIYSRNVGKPSENPSLGVKK